MSILGNEMATILIVGNENGLGLAIARRLISMGHEVVILVNSQAEFNEAHAASPQLSVNRANCLDEKVRHEVIKHIMTDYPKLNVLINNFGINNSPYPLKETTDRDWILQQNEYEANVMTAIHLTMLLLPHFTKKKHSAIINVTSILAFAPYAPFATYSSSKAALHSFTQSTRAQLSKSHVRVVEIIPPVFETDAARTTEEETPKLEQFADYVTRDLEAGMEEIYYHSENIVRGTRNELDRLTREWSNKGGEDVFSQSKA